MPHMGIISPRFPLLKICISENSLNSKWEQKDRKCFDSHVFSIGISVIFWEAYV